MQRGVQVQARTRAGAVHGIFAGANKSKAKDNHASTSDRHTGNGKFSFNRVGNWEHDGEGCSQRDRSS